MPLATATVGSNQQQQTRNGNGKLSAGISVGWPTERWVGLIILVALGLLILIRTGFRGIGFTGNVGARVNV